MKKTLIAFLLSLTFFLAIGTLVVYAQSTGPGTTNQTRPPITIDNPFRGGDTLFELLETVVNDIILPIGGVLAVLAFIYSGFLYVAAQGDTTKIKNAHNALLYTAIGTAVLLGSWALANVIKGTINQLMT